MRESVDALQKGENIVIFPEISDKGYLAELEGFHAGFIALCETCKKKGIDVPVYVTYFRKSDLKYVVDAPVLYSELTGSGASREEVIERLLKRCNELGKMQFNEGMSALNEEVAVAK